MNTNAPDDIENLKQEVVRLRQVVNELQGERQQDRQALEKLRNDWMVCLQYFASLSEWPYTREQLEQWALGEMERFDKHPEDYLPLSAFIGDLETPGHRNGK